MRRRTRKEILAHCYTQLVAAWFHSPKSFIILVQNYFLSRGFCGSLVVMAAISHFGRLDILIKNAGVMLLGPVLDAETEDWRRMFNVNVMRLMYAMHAALPGTVEQGGGHVVNISSAAGRFTGPPSAVYSATKFAVNSFSEGLRKQVSEKAARVTVIEPGAVATELQSHITHEARARRPGHNSS